MFDFRKLNSETEKDNDPIPSRSIKQIICLIENIFLKL